MISLFIATPAFGEMFYSVYVRSLFGLQHVLAARGWPCALATLSFSDLVESRSVLLTHWFDRTNASHLLFIDADMGFDPKLIVDMVELDQPVVGALYPKRKLDLSKYERAIAAGDAPSRARAKAHDFTVRGPGVGAHKGFIRVEGCGAGILLLRRDCIATLLDRQPQHSDASARLTSPIAHGLDRLIRVFDPIRFENAYLSEDYAFCYRWRLCGGDVWAAAGPRDRAYRLAPVRRPLQRPVAGKGSRAWPRLGHEPTRRRTGPRGLSTFRRAHRSAASQARLTLSFAGGAERSDNRLVGAALRVDGVVRNVV